MQIDAGKRKNNNSQIINRKWQGLHETAYIRSVTKILEGDKLWKNNIVIPAKGPVVKEKIASSLYSSQ